jgi:hypothetical protein
MSMTTHRFHSFQTLARAQEWLGQIGITPDRIEVSSTGLPSMTVQTDFARLPEVELVINAAEMTDPDGWPALDELGPRPMAPIEVAAEATPPQRLHTSPIGWHPID